MNKKSFTLIELLVVIAIIGILSSLVIARFSDWNDNARIANTLQWSAGVHRTLGANLIGHWPLNEGSGATAKDVSGYGRNGIIVGSPLWVNGVPGAGNQALKFNGADYVNCGERLTFKVGSISVWFRTSSSGSHQIVSGVFTETSYGLGIEGGKLHMGISTGAGDRRRTVNLFNDDNWNHGVVVVTGLPAPDHIIMYVNGEFQALEDTSSSRISTYLAIAVRYTAGDWSMFFSGPISDVRIYDTALTAEEVGRIYAETKDSYLAYE